MGTKFATKFDYFQAVFGIVVFAILLSINTNLGTLILGFIIIVFGIYKAFGRRILFYEKSIIVIHLFSKTKLNFSEVNKVSYITQLYGKPILRIATSQKSFKGYIDYSEWIMLEKWLVEREIKCNEVR